MRPRANRLLLAALGLAVVGLATSPALAVDSPSADLPTYTEEIDVFGARPVVAPVALGEPVRIVFGIGELDIEAAEVSEMRAELVLECRKVREDRCGRYKKKLKVEPVRTENGLEVRMSGLSMRILRRVNVTGRVVVPKWSPLSVKIGIGDVDIEAGEEDVDVTMKIGDLKVRVPEETVGNVTARTRIGDAGIVLPGRHLDGKRKMLIGAKATWHGDGDSDVTVRLRIGDARVRLK